ncbi:ribosomal RNA small subunit methyltransferase D [Clostridium homopropionicum DSM 5847]|uniref:Ribosomal RNA small subunit methyltransferase D n=1 Tax=Clostridium homopropionicum DSM 5847 TaxID=1121318 RepID=A0A0L6ZC45_9CLOT|nr:16S rRNA (guanine(966)-N(2))-methyltransferase RsmD [Clostridium homopropionicum]KOA20536.1 ribosomal RNA small subunit methyltransferase D [Clostridium homopropionicum DSM 5847]SFG37991.1 16S rRNA (guanine966-N2)-methyltransferase [Clostridium homopropionicum]
MRIISGIAKGKKILPPDGIQTRPTLDRVKENIFNIIQNDIVDANAVDVFAGTGSLGLEAVSRGAKECYLVDKHPSTFNILMQNVKNLGFQEKCKCINKDSYAALKDFSKKGLIFDLIFIDPPYAKDMIPPAIEIITSESLLAENGIIVTKIDSSEDIYKGNEKIVLYDYRKYGNTTVCFYKHGEV